MESNGALKTRCQSGWRCGTKPAVDRNQEVRTSKTGPPNHGNPDASHVRMLETIAPAPVYAQARFGAQARRLSWMAP